MVEDNNVMRVLVQHFFRRFFDNDTVQVDGDTQTTVTRAIAIAAAPGLMMAFFSLGQYPPSPHVPRSLWDSIMDQYFFVLLSFLVMGAVSIFEWEMLFPDRLDFLILSPLSLKPRQMLAAKAAALVGFLSLFLVSCNFWGTLILSGVSNIDFLRQIYAHGTAVLLAGVFAALFVLALGGVLLCVLDETRFRLAAPAMQAVCVLALVLLMIEYAQYGDAMQAWLSKPTGMERWLPPVWFLGLYEVLLRGEAAPAFAREVAPYALRGTAAAGVVAVATYPQAWARVRRMAIEGNSRQRGGRPGWMTAIMHRVARRPGERAVFHFIGQTMARNNRYQVYLAMYCGTGLAIAVACALHLQMAEGSVRLVLSLKGLHAVMPLLLFWAIAGLRTAFGFPLNLPAAWVFRCTGVRMSECSAAARHWVLSAAACVMAVVLATLAAAGWSLRTLLVQAVWGVCLCVVLSDGFFCFQHRVPFTKPRMPGRTSLPLMLTLYVGMFPLFVYGVIYAEGQMERNLWKLAWLVGAAVAFHLALALVSRGYEEVEEEMEGYEGEFQVLGLS